MKSILTLIAVVSLFASCTKTNSAPPITYYFRVAVIDTAGNMTHSDVYRFDANTTNIGLGQTTNITYFTMSRIGNLIKAQFTVGSEKGVLRYELQNSTNQNQWAEAKIITPQGDMSNYYTSDTVN